MKPLDIVLIVAIVATVGLAVWRIVRNKRQGKSSCGCDCGHCAASCGRRQDQQPPA